MTASIRTSTAANYYLKVEHSLYYLTGELGVGLWYGEGANSLGFQGPVQPEQLIHAYDGLSPDGTTQLVQRQEGKHQRKPAWDMTLSAGPSQSRFYGRCPVPSIGTK